MKVVIKSYSLLSLLFIISCFPSPDLAGQFTDQEFEEMAATMAKGKVKDMELADIKENFEDFVLLDAREKKEYDVSHIPGALWIGYDDFDVKRLEEISKSKRIITYCSVGYRSERIGEKLMEAGYTDVSNFKGSIFKWVNDGNVVVDKNENPTLKVHGFNKKWSKWIKSGTVVF